MNATRKDLALIPYLRPYTDPKDAILGKEETEPPTDYRWEVFVGIGLRTILIGPSGTPAPTIERGDSRIARKDLHFTKKCATILLRRNEI